MRLHFRAKGRNRCADFYNENDYQAHLQKLSMGDLNEEVSIVDIPQEGNYLIALYLFDNTELNYYIRQNQEQKMVAGLIYGQLR